LTGFSSWKWYLRFLRDPIGCMMEIGQRSEKIIALGSPAPFTSGGRKFVLAIGEDYNREVLGQPDLYRPGGLVMVGPKGSAHQRLRRGIFTKHGEEHRTHRRLMQPPFLKPSAEAHAPVMAKLIDQVLDRWRPGEQVDMHREMLTLSNWVAANILFGNEDFDASIQLGKTIGKWLDLDARARRHSIPLNFPGSRYRRLLRHADITEQEISATIQRVRNTKTDDSNVLSILIRAFDDSQSGMTLDDVKAHAVILYAASFETTANALAWTLFLLSQNRRALADLHIEIAGAAKDWPPDIQMIDTLPVLDGVIQESMRLLPPVAFTMRTATKPAELGGLSLRAGDKVVLSHFMTHRDPDVFPEPGRFNPARWASLRPSPYASIPFSAGPRRCLGYSFAALELKLAIFRIVQRFRVSMVPGSTVDAVVLLTLQPANGLPMMVDHHDGTFPAVSVKGNVHDFLDIPG
jgi:cytochrome P450